MKIKNRLFFIESWCIILFIVILPQMCSNGIADTRPQMPAQFDRDTIVQLLGNIEHKHNAAILRAGYFMKRGRTEFPQIDGLSLLKRTIDAETIASKRWFILQSLYGFASFRVPGASQQDGIAAYGTLFKKSNEAIKVDADYSLRQAINEFVFSLNGRVSNPEIRFSSQTHEVLLNAWDAYSRVLAIKDNSEKTQRREPDWAQLIAKTRSAAVFLPHIELALNDQIVPKTYYFFKVASAVYAEGQPNRAIEMLRRAKPQLPLNNDEESADFYHRYVDVLISEKHISDAITTQQEYVQRFGRGQAKLALMHRQDGDETAFKIVLTSLSSANANEREINNLSEMLYDFAQESDNKKTQCEEEIIKLISAYLDAPRQRNVEQELRARKTLGLVYINQQKSREAMTAFQIDSLKQPSQSPRSRLYISEIEKLQILAKQKSN